MRSERLPPPRHGGDAAYANVVLHVAFSTTRGGETALPGAAGHRSSPRRDPRGGGWSGRRAAALCDEPGATVPPEADRWIEGVFAALPAPARYGSVRHLHEVTRGAVPPSMRRGQGMLYLLGQYCTQGGSGSARCRSWHQLRFPRSTSAGAVRGSPRRTVFEGEDEGGFGAPGEHAAG